MLEFVGILVYFIIASLLATLIIGLSFVFSTIKPDPEKISADIVVMAGGATIPVGEASEQISRDFLAERKSSVAAEFGEQCLTNHNSSHLQIT